MAVLIPDRPTISSVYAAFDAECQRVFRRAMQLSTGSVVKIPDLLRALTELARAAGDGIVPDSWLPPSLAVASDVWLSPMSNDPALRTVLEQAYLAAHARHTPVVLTPRHLWETLAALGHLPGSARPHHSTSAPKSDSPIGAKSRTTTAVRELLEIILNRWLAAHQHPDHARRDAEIESLKPLVNQLEQQQPLLAGEP